MHDQFDVDPIDLDSLAEIAIMTDLMIAVANSQAERLTPDTIDAILHVGGALEAGRSGAPTPPESRSDLRKRSVSPSADSRPSGR